MLYPRSKDPYLTEELFRNPGSEYRGTPFWAWNCELHKEELLEQLEILKQMGLGGAHMHVRTGMATKYLSDEHMDLVKACVDKCKKEDMLAWLYDEDRWPSGAAGGLLTKDPKYRARHLLLTIEPYSENGISSINYEMCGRTSRSEQGSLLTCYDVILDDKGYLAYYEQIDQDVPAKGVKWYAYLETDPENPWYNNQTYANTLDKATIDKFIEITYEKYLKNIGGEFGKTVPAIFTDEPQFTHKSTLSYASEAKDVFLPWTDDIPETFAQQYGEDILAHLPELLWELPDGRVSVIRYHYHDHIAERFASSFADRCGKWCEEHGLMLTGHMMEEPTLGSQTAALGEAMRSYRSFGLPGMDLVCNRHEFTTAKQVQSAVHQYGRPGALSECYGVTGWAYDFRGHKLQGDWQAALGITVRVPHLSWVSMKGEAKRDYPASINYQSPWWKSYAYVEDHFARVVTAMTRGKPVVRLGVIHPVESYWLHWGPSEQTYGARKRLDEQFINLTDTLLAGNMDFDFIAESLLPDLCPEAGNPLTVGEMQYDTIIVPGCETLRSTTLERLEVFRKNGGKLVFLGEPPRYIDAIPDTRAKALYDRSEHSTFSAESIFEVLNDVRLVSVIDEEGKRTENLIHQLREDGNGYWLFIAHGFEPYFKDISSKQNLRITLKGEYTVRIYDTLTGDIKPARYCARNGFTTVYSTMYDYDSLLLRFDRSEPGSCTLPPETVYPNRISVNGLADYTLSEPNVYLMDIAEYALDDEKYHAPEEILRADNAMREVLGWPGRRGAVAQPWVLPPEEITHRARFRFTLTTRIDLSDTHLALEDADVSVISVDGEKLCAVSDGWFTDKSIRTVPMPVLKAGTHTIEIDAPFGRSTNPEWCYLLGEFGVEVFGSERFITNRPEKIGFDDITRQLLPYYGGNIDYHIPFRSNGKALKVTISQYDGAAMRIALDGKDMGVIAYPPYSMELGTPSDGDHELVITLLGNRQNCFGPVHWADTRDTWIGPDAWRSEGDAWTYSYRLTSIGIRTTPIIEEA